MPQASKKSRGVKVDVSLPVMFLKEGEMLAAYTPAFDLSTCGDTSDEAQKMFAEAVDIFLNELTKVGTLDEVVAECGWRKVSRPRKRWVPPELLGQSVHTVIMPMAVAV